MRVVVYGINYAPEVTGIGKYTGEMAEWLALKGHDVRVVTSPPYYPDWRVRSGWKWYSYRIDQLNGVRVFRAPLWVPQRPGGLQRLLHLASFVISSLPLLLAQAAWRPNVVLVVAPALMSAPSALAVAALSGACGWLHIQDYEIDAAFGLGLLKGSALRRLVEAFERWLLRRFDRISTISGRMLERATTKGVVSRKLIHFPNWVDISGIGPLTAPSLFRAELSFTGDTVVALYSGNMGNKQGLEILADVAHLLKDVPRIQFVFCGKGSGRADLESRCAGLTNVRFLDLQPLEKLNDLLGLADIHLLPQRADAADLVMPSKLTGMLASGRAVVATALPQTELGRVVSQDAACGLIVAPEDPVAMANAVMTLADDPVLRAQMGASGRAYAERELDRDVILGRFERQLRDLVGGASA